MLPNDTADEAERLTRHAREANDADEADAARRQRDELLAQHGYIAREREPDATLVLYPRDWLTDSDGDGGGDADRRVRIEHIEDTDRAIERPLEAPEDDTNWEDTDTHNREIAARVTERYGEVHGKNAATFADFMSNHYVLPIEKATERMREEFLDDYFPRNAWPSKKQQAIVEQSIELALEVART